jgi:glycosyltransferase involved in cell wall biosynthesis
MRIAMVSEHASPLAVLGGVDAGGQNVHVASLAAALAGLGASVTVYTRRDDPALPERVPLTAGVDVVHLDAGPAREVSKDLLWPWMPRFSSELGRHLELERPDVVHSHFWMSGAASIWACAPLGIPIAHTFHALGVVKRRFQGAGDPSPADRVDVERGLLRRVGHVIATCSDEVFELARMGAEVRSISVIPCGVDLEQFNPGVPADPRTGAGFRLAVVSRLVERKGIGNTIEALSALPGCRLVIAGGPARDRLAEDPVAARLIRLAAELGVGDRVEFLGQVSRDDVPGLMRSADAVICVPWYEPFGIVPVEAMACGVPVIACAVGGIVDTVVHERTGLHVPPRRPDLVAAAVSRLRADHALARRLGRAGARRAHQRYGWDAVAASTLRVYEHMVRPASGVRWLTAPGASR